MSFQDDAAQRWEEQYQRLGQWHRQGTPGPGPVSLTLFPTNICNIECKHCWQRWGSYDKTYKSEMSDERLLRLVGEAAEMGVQRWYFVGGGDPMGRHKLVMEMVRRIRAHGMNGGIHTNGTLFKPHYIEELVELGWEQIRVSLDGPTAEINDYIRSRGFDKATTNVRMFADQKLARGVEAPDIAIYNTVTNLTYDKIDQFVELAHRLGVGCELSGLIVEEEGSKQFELTAEQKAAFPDFVRKGLERAKELGVRTNFQAYLDEEITLDSMNMHRAYRNIPGGGIISAMCYEPYHSVSIQPDGSMGPCCAFYATDANSIKERSFAEVWNGPYMTSVREGMLNGSPPAYCRRCPSNLFVAKEKNRVMYATRLREEEKRAQWETLNPVQRAAYVASRAAHSVAEVGITGTIRRSKRWLEVVGKG